MPLQLSTFKIPELVDEVKSELEPIIMRSKLTVTLEHAAQACRRSRAIGRR